MISDSALFAVIAVTFFGFLGLAFVVLRPFSKLLDRAEEEERNWTPDAIARASRRARHGGDGASGKPPAPPAPPSSN